MRPANKTIQSLETHVVDRHRGRVTSQPARTVCYLWSATHESFLHSAPVASKTGRRPKFFGIRRLEPSVKFLQPAHTLGGLSPKRLPNNLWTAVNVSFSEATILVQNSASHSPYFTTETRRKLGCWRNPPSAHLKYRTQQNGEMKYPWRAAKPTTVV